MKKISAVSVLHYIRLVYRSIMFLAALVFYIIGRVRHGTVMMDYVEEHSLIVDILWLIFMVEMIFRFFPSKLESPGCQKQFKRNYIKSGKTEIQVQDNNGTMLVALVWLCFNAVFGTLHMTRILDDGIMILLSCAFSVCDMVCILFFCPFQTWFLKNKCCSSCRIYNWDYAMMFTPLFFIQNKYTWTLLLMAVILMIRWEVTFFRYPERFSETTNEYLKCANCTEKLCVHKRHLKSLWVRIAEFTAEQTRKLKK